MPSPVSPILEGYEDKEIVIAKSQPQYNPLPALRSASGIVLSRWKLTAEERQAVADGVDIYLFNYTFNQRLQPISMVIPTCPADYTQLADIIDR